MRSHPPQAFYQNVPIGYHWERFPGQTCEVLQTWTFSLQIVGYILFFLKILSLRYFAVDGKRKKKGTTNTERSGVHTRVFLKLERPFCVCILYGQPLPWESWFAWRIPTWGRGKKVEESVLVVPYYSAEPDCIHFRIHRTSNVLELKIWNLFTWCYGNLVE